MVSLSESSLRFQDVFDAPDPLYAHSRLAAIYDVVEGERDDLGTYLDIVDEFGAEFVLDVGCGTGSLAVLLAESGRTVVGVDPAEASLAVARAKHSGVTWVHGDATVVGALGVDLATMTANVAQVFRTDAAWEATLAGIRAALRPGGHLVFETRRPECRAWEQWDGVTTVDVPGIGRVEHRREVTEVRLPLVSFRETFRFADGAVVASESTLRFRDRDEIEASLVATGYDLVDVRDAADRPGREFVVIAQRR
ncbi:methyltransferase [Actinokineospora fastidiosa]|uniref:Methyltransferase n=1 Tax=Actinokineospora fastidiosa TaxID=1816 RepID=A0A918GAW0_9PSEU|nr:methyltransferase [Actinokineospora fastidiosa]